VIWESAASARLQKKFFRGRSDENVLEIFAAAFD
jgi:hypothetical protein